MNTASNELKVNQIVTVDGYIAIVTAVYASHCGVTVQFHGKVIKTVVETSKVKAVDAKAKYSKEAQLKMFNRVHSAGFIQIDLVTLDFENVWGFSGECIRIKSAKRLDMVKMY